MKLDQETIGWVVSALLENNNAHYSGFVDESDLIIVLESLNLTFKSGDASHSLLTDYRAKVANRG